MSPHQGQPKHLAWHETMELHELVAFQTSQLVAFKKKLPSLHDRGLQSLYTEAIRGIEANLQELLQFYPQAPQTRKSDGNPELIGPESAQLLGFAKTSVRNYAIAITETATPQLRSIFQKQLLNAIALHAKVFNFMYERGLYPAYDLNALLAGDVANARAALSL